MTVPARTVVITGAASGIGLALVRRILDREPDTRLIAVDIADCPDERADSLLCDLSDLEAIAALDLPDAIDALAKATNTRRRHLSVHERGRVILVALEQVIYLKAELKYITVRTREREYLIEESLTSLEEEFSDRFVRIHRNALVARPSIAGFERVSPSGEGESGDPYWQVVLREVPDRLPVSRRQWSIVKGLVS